MNDKPEPAGPAPASEPLPPRKARHGFRNEVSWNHGEGRQPYSNQGAEEAREPNLGNEFEGGDQGEHAGVAREQLKQAKGTPQVGPTRQSRP